MATVLIITLDAPDPEGFKGGLYPEAIRQHVSLGLDVVVASLAPVEKRHEEAISALGARLLPTFVANGSLSQFEGVLKRLEGRFRLGLLTTLRRIESAARSVDPICVLGLQSYQSGFAARYIGLRLGVPYICWEHLSGYHRGARFNRKDIELGRLFSESYVTAGVSMSVVEAIRKRFSVDLPQARVIPNSIPKGFTDKPMECVPQWLEESTEGRFLFASWTSWRKVKRLDILLQAFNKVNARYPVTSLVVAGNIDDSEYAGLVKSQNGRHVLFPGPLSRSNVHQLAHRANCCCISSDVETFGLPMIEALAAGKPVVSTRCGGPNDVLDDPRLGRLCECGDVDGLAAAMTEVYENKQRFDDLAITRMALERFGEEAQLARWRSIYEPLLADGCLAPRTSEWG